jgi:hypothetical protein
MTFQPPAQTVFSIRRGDGGTGVWALQRALNELGLFTVLVEDGSFGPATERTVKAFQDLRKITADGIAGPATQDHLARKLIAANESNLPAGLLQSLVDGESGSLIAAVNWSVAGGVDCGYTQRRVMGPPFDGDAVRRAFDSGYEFKLLRTQLLDLHGIFMQRPAVDTHEFAWRLAVLNHNWPSGADRLSRTRIADLSSYWTTPQEWVTSIGARFPDGASIRTPLQWAEHYSLGSVAHNDPGRMCRFVKEWT